MSRLIASAVLVVFASLLLAGTALCDGKTDMPNCCCALASAPVGSAAAKLCCETVCGKEANETPSTPAETLTSAMTPALAVAAVRVEPFYDMLPAALPVALKSVERAVAHQDPPALYLRKATLLN
jgi:hypothetical protein